MSDEAPPVTDFTYHWQVLCVPSAPASEAEGFLEYVEDTATAETKVEGPITPSAWQAAVEAATETFLQALADELDEYDLEDLTIEDAEP